MTMRRRFIFMQRITAGICVAGLCVCVFATCVGMWGCARNGEVESEAADSGAASTSYIKSYDIADGSEGLIRVSIDATKAGLLAGFTLRVQYVPASADADQVVVSEPDPANALPAGWSAHPEPDAGASSWAWTLEPFVPGEFEFGELAITCRTVSDNDEIVVTTEPVTLTVLSLLPADDKADVTPSDIKGVLAPPRPWWLTWWFITLVLVFVFLVLPTTIVLSVWLLRRRLSCGADADAVRRAMIQVSAHELALRRLTELLARDLLSQGRVKDFYGELTWIMRQYIEDRFGLRAPDRTTEEFLDESRQTGVFSSADLDLFDRFLGHCDLVKFAEAQPTTSQVDAAVQSIRTFIDRTKSDGVQVAVSGGAE